MDYQTIGVSEEAGVAVVTLDRPEVMNAMTAQMRAELKDAIQTLPAGGARVIVLTGAGRAFCSGQDLGDVESAADVELERVLREEYGPLILAMRDAPVPIIAAVNGPAAGAGANLALAADVAIAAESAYFLEAFARIGLMPDAGGTWFLPRRAGLARAMGAALFAEPIPARLAESWGLIWEAVPDAEFEARWRARARALAEGPALAFRAIKRALYASDGNDLDSQLELEAELQGRLGNSRDFQEGVTAFLQKRPARFEGR